MGTMQEPDRLSEPETDEISPLRDVFAALLNTDGHSDRVQAITKRYRGNSRIHRVDNAVRPPREEKKRSDMYNVHSAPPKKGYTIIIRDSESADPVVRRENTSEPIAIPVSSAIPK
jgi:hypothetical protein